MDQLIQNYEPSDSLEIAYKAQIIDFVLKNPNAFERSLLIGHITASAFIADIENEKILLMHHKKLNKWLQPGGHCDGEKDTFAVAKKEVFEETGIVITQVEGPIFDIDIHSIPTKNTIPEHLHYDIRYLFEVNSNEAINGNHESFDLKWINFTDVKNYTTEESILRVMKKLMNLK